MSYRIGQRLALYDVVLLRPHQSVSGPPALPMASEPEVATGDLVAVVGYPQNTIEGDVLLVTFGIVVGSARWGEGVTAPLYHVLDAFSGLIEKRTSISRQAATTVWA